MGVLFLFSCERRVDVVQTSLSPESLTSPAKQGEVVFTVVSPQPWRIVSSGSWCKPIPMDGGPTSSVGTAVSIWLEENEGFERECEISLIVGEETVASAVVSQGLDEAGLVFGQTRYKISGSTNRLEIPYYSATEISVEPLCTWVSVSQVMQDRIILDIETHASLLNRTGQVCVTASDGKERTLDIIQGDGFSDSQMYGYMLRLYDIDGDGFLSKEEAATVEQMNLKACLLEYEHGFLEYSHDIPVLDGFDYFPNLRELTIDANREWNYPIRNKLYVDGHPSLTSLTITGHIAELTFISASNCPNLERVTLENGYNLHSADVSYCPKLRVLHLVNGVFGLYSDRLSSLNLIGSPHIESLTLGGATFSEEPDFGPLEDVRSVSFSSMAGVRCLDLSKSRFLESVSWIDYSSNHEQNRLVLIPSSRQALIKTNCDAGIEIRCP